MTTDPTLDRAALDRLLEITGGDVGFLDELVDTFLEDAAAQLDALRDVAERNDVDGLVRPAHSLKSNADNVGALALMTLSRELEAAGRSGAVPDAIDRVAEINDEFGKVRAALLQSRLSR